MDPDLGSKSTELSTAAACRWASAGRAETVLMRFPDVLCFLLTPEDAVPPHPRLLAMGRWVYGGGRGAGSVCGFAQGAT